MNRTFSVICLFFSGMLLLCGQQQNIPSYYTEFYRQAESYYNTDNPTSRTDSLALVNYQKVITLLLQKKENENLLVECYTKTGILYQANNHDSAAINNFLKANSFKQVASLLPDSLFFQPNLFAGASYYTVGNYDSALFFFKQAEKIVNQYKRLPEAERLYNKMGALYYQSGNYRQSINYFNKSISLLNPVADGYTDFLVQYKTNLGAAYFKLKEYDKAMDIYESLLPLKTATRPSVLHNIGSIYLEKGDYARALQYLAPLQYNQQFKLTDFARIYINLKKTDSAKYYLDSAIAENKKMNGTRKNITQGLALKFYGDIEAGQNNMLQALNYYQQSIIQFDPDFFEEDMLKNPTQFNGIHSSFNLFAVLIAKAEAFKLLYVKEKNSVMLSAAMDAYKAAFKLAEYVERFLDTDEARLFLKKNVEDSYSGAVETAIEAYEITAKKEYLHEAFVFSEASKGSILQTNRQQLQIGQITGIPQDLVHEERNIKANIARLTLQAAAVTDSIGLAHIQQQVSDFEIKLSRVQEKLNENPRYNQLRYNYQALSVKEIQENFIGANTALLSYYFTKQHLVSFVITSDDFLFSKAPTDSFLTSKIIAARVALEQSGSYDKTAAGEISHFLFNRLIKPVYAAIKNKKKLVVIPHNELHYIPFEIVENPATGNWLLKDFAISYNYSASFLAKKENTNSHPQVLAFAPFTQALASIDNLPENSFTPLGASGAEVQALSGNILTDTAATKSNFLKFSQQYEIIHLATHANANDSIPVESFIAFYPRKNGTGMQNRLYQPEISNLNLSKTSLVILSACETGKGSLVSGEGIMSLSRAFSYAGCQSVITSLWKAEDNATAFIMQQLHKYLQQGMGKDEALQKAKLAYLESDKVDARFKTPDFWANLILVGDPSPIYNNNDHPFYWLFAAIFVLAASFFSARRFNRKKVYQKETALPDPNE